MAIQEHGSLGKVRQVLNLTQPALSRNLRELERQLGVTLFERHPSGLRATQFCHALLPYAASMLQAAEQAVEEVRILAGESQHTVRIGALPVGSVTILPQLIGKLVEEAPGIRIKVVEGIGEVLVNSLKSREIDIIITGGLPDDDEIVLALDLGLEVESMLLVGEQHPLLHNSDRNALKVIDQPWVMLPQDSTYRKEFERLMQKNGLPLPKPLVETRSSDLLRRLVSDHGFITWAPLVSLGSGNNRIVAVDIPPFTVRQPYNVYRLRRGVISGAMRRTLSILLRLTRPSS